jgi:tryptophan-rich sensory protein
MRKKDLIKLLISISAVVAAGAIGSVITSSSVTTWYVSLPKPSFNPPSWVFGPVWTVLFLLMAIAAYLIWKKGWKRPEVRVALSLYSAQLVLNVLWTVLFFGYHNLAAAYVEIIILWFVIFLTMEFFRDISKTAAWLLLPYLLWVAFAAVLTFSIWNISFQVQEGTLLYIPANSTVKVTVPVLPPSSIK